jgi:hypothetical protein
MSEGKVSVDKDVLARVLRAFYVVYNPARIDDNPAAVSNFDALVNYYHNDVQALQDRLRDQYGAVMSPQDLRIGAYAEMSANFDSGFGANGESFRHPLEPPS